MIPGHRDRARGCMRNIVGTYSITSCIQALPRGLNLVRTGLELTYRHIVNLVFSVVRHRFFIKVLAINPLQRYPLRGRKFVCAEVAAALNLELETISHIASRVDLDSKILISMRTHPVRPVVFEGMAIVDQQFDKEGSRRALFRHRRRFRLGS